MNGKQTPQLHEDDIHPDAMQIIWDLQRRGYVAYLVGGCVRDLLLGRHPKDFDIATDARPQEVRRCIPQAYVIGKRFRLVLARRGDDLFEIATFRRDLDEGETLAEGASGDNLFGTPEDDANRRDFTINALFYDPIKQRLIDYAHGMSDLHAGVVRVIGVPEVRLAEDPIRILRAIRLAHMIRFAREPSLKRGIAKLAGSLTDTALPRRREELLKFLRLEDPSMAFLTCEDLDVMRFLLPTVHKALQEGTLAAAFYRQLRHLHRVRLESPTELFAVFMLTYLKVTKKLDLDQDDLRQFKVADVSDEHTLMRDELGMFKSEQANFVKAVQLLAQLRRRKDFERRGEKRRWTLFRNEAFPLAVKLAQHEMLVSPEDLHYWKTEFTKSPPDLVRSGSKSGRRRRRRPRPRKAGGDASGSGGAGPA